jgi:hypothetical protein
MGRCRRGLNVFGADILFDCVQRHCSLLNWQLRCESEGATFCQTVGTLFMISPTIIFRLDRLSRRNYFGINAQ